MATKIKELEFQRLLKLLEEHDIESVYEEVNILPNSDDLRAKVEKYVDTKSINKRSVFGIDIYRYTFLTQTSWAYALKGVCSRTV